MQSVGITETATCKYLKVGCLKLITMKKIVSILAIALLASCSSNKYIKLTKLNDEINPSENLISFFKNNPNPKVVVRTNSTSMDVTESAQNNYLYDVVEKVLLKNGFVVRDRQLFNKIISNDENTIDYSQLKTKTDTDIIIEVNKLNREKLYETNKYVNDKSKEFKLVNPFKINGAEVEFKVTLIKDNEFAGTYKFNYTPCSLDNGCKIDESFDSKWKRIKKGKEKETYEIVQTSVMEDFMKNATEKLVESIKK